ncbi:helix-turn-helix domain-containing protein [Eubacterium sp. 1001713B170207_170306_E7]|uniref:PucR family transcriptional regulator n=1 Tax=Eubacterium sp. 1001713B170207_170306_E7 TaxID=2787097 RepID=UPI00189ABFAA|nr:helix-turn-helix domain-containing protein [Eubacterium sp. 1001713B170207_170306_E7]
MKISIPILAESLKMYPNRYEIADTMDISLVNIRYYRAGTAFKDSILYLAGDAEILDRSQPLPQNLMVVFSKDAYKKHCGLKLSSPNYLFISGLDKETAFEKVQDIFEKYNRLYDELMAAGLNYGSRSLKELLNLIVRVMGNPLFIMDAKHTLYNYGLLFFDSCDAAWREIIDTGVLNRSISAYLENVKTHQKENTYDFIAIPGEDGRHPGYALYVYENAQQTEPFFIMAVIENRQSFQLYHQQLLVCFSHIIRALFKRDFMLNFSKVDLLERLIFRSLNNRSIDADFLNHALSKNRWKNGEGFLLSRIKITASPDERTKNQVLRSLKTTFTDSIAVIPAFNKIEGTVYKVADELILLTFTGARDFHLKGFLDRLSQFLELHHSQAVVSDKFYCFEELNRHYQNMEFIITTCFDREKGRRLFLYSDYYNAQILRLLAEQLELQSLCHPDAVKLKQYDQQHQSQLLHTLYIYWQSNHALVDSAKTLCVHRNTLVYRLDRIRELLGIDQFDHAYTTRMAFSYEIFHYLESF